MAAEADIIRYVITGEDGEIIPRNATHVSVHPSVKVIPRRIFYAHPRIVELICHDGVIKIEMYAFIRCRRLKRVIMKSVEEVEGSAFKWCTALEYVECDKLEIIGRSAFAECRSIININLPSAKKLREFAFRQCRELKYVKFGRKLESIGEKTFYRCRSLQRITIPLRNGLFEHDNTFQCCEDLEHVDLVDEEAFQQTIDALLWEEWKNDMNAEVASIVQILPNASAGNYDDEGDKAIVIRQWITNVLHKFINYQSQHCRLLKDAASRLQLALPHDIVMNNVVPFIKLPQYTFDREEEIDESYSSAVDSGEEEEYNGSSEGGDAQIDEEGQQEGVNREERRKRQRTESYGDDADGEEHD